MGFTYLIGWSKHNKFYYGCRYGKNGCSSSLWTTYFTSSKFVKEFRNLYGEPDIIQIRKEFLTDLETLLWEKRVIEKLKKKSNFNIWLNRNCAGSVIYTEDVLQKMRGPKSITHKNNMKKARKKLMETGFKPPNPALRDDVKKKMSENKKVNYVGKGNPMYGKKHSEESKKKMSLSAKNRKNGKVNNASVWI